MVCLFRGDLLIAFRKVAGGDVFLEPLLEPGVEFGGEFGHFGGEVGFLEGIFRYGGAGGRAELVRVGLGEGDAVGDELVEVRGFEKEVIGFRDGEMTGVSADVGDAEIVGEDEDDVGEVRRRATGRRTGRGKAAASWLSELIESGADFIFLEAEIEGLPSRWPWRCRQRGGQSRRVGASALTTLGVRRPFVT